MPWRQANSNVENAPSAPASVGVAQPNSIEVKISRITIQIGAVGGSDSKRWRQLKPVIGRPISGFSLQRTITITQYTSAEMMPGTKPAISRSPIDCSTMMP